MEIYTFKTSGVRAREHAPRQWAARPDLLHDEDNAVHKVERHIVRLLRSSHAAFEHTFAIITVERMNKRTQSK